MCQGDGQFQTLQIPVGKDVSGPVSLILHTNEIKERHGVVPIELGCPSEGGKCLSVMGDQGHLHVFHHRHGSIDSSDLEGPANA